VPHNMSPVDFRLSATQPIKSTPTDAIAPISNTPNDHQTPIEIDSDDETKKYTKSPYDPLRNKLKDKEWILYKITTTRGLIGDTLEKREFIKEELRKRGMQHKLTKTQLAKIADSHAYKTGLRSKSKDLYGVPGTIVELRGKKKKKQFCFYMGSEYVHIQKHPEKKIEAKRSELRKRFLESYGKYKSLLHTRKPYLSLRNPRSFLRNPMLNMPFTGPAYESVTYLGTAEAKYGVYGPGRNQDLWDFIGALSTGLSGNFDTWCIGNGFGQEHMTRVHMAFFCALAHVIIESTKHVVAFH
jgi:hypothetical protein